MQVANSHKHLGPDTITLETYPELSKSFKFRLGMSCTLLILLSFWVNFPLQERITNYITHNVLSQLPCPINYSSLSTGYFPPRLIFRNLEIPGACLASGRSLKLNDFSARLALPSIFPPGPRFHIPLIFQDSSLKMNVTPSFSSLHFSLRNAKLGDALLNYFLPMNFVAGDFAINTVGKMPYTGHYPEKAHFSLVSRNLVILPQNIQGFLLPQLKLKNLSLKTTILENRVQIEEFILGGDDTPFTAVGGGRIELAPHIEQSQLHIDLNVRFSKDFLESFSFLTLFIRSYQNEDGSYSLSLRGPMSAPTLL